MLSSLRVASALCAFVLAWLGAHTCAAQYVPAVLRTQLPPVTTLNYDRTRVAEQSALTTPQRRWLWAAASTGIAFAAGFAVSEGLELSAQRDRAGALTRSRDLTADLDLRMKAERQADSAQRRASLLDSVSDICLAGSVAATGATLLIWLTSKHRRKDHRQPKVLLGPMVLRGVNGGGIVLREKF